MLSKRKNKDGNFPPGWIISFSFLRSSTSDRFLKSQLWFVLSQDKILSLVTSQVLRQISPDHDEGFITLPWTEQYICRQWSFIIYFNL